jgi:hypothetical protein
LKEYSDKELAQRLEQNNRPLSGIYYWIVVNKNGKNIVIGCKSSEQEAEQFAYQKTSESYKIIPLKTRNLDAAIRMMKGKILNDTSNLDVALQKFKRKH